MCRKGVNGGFEASAAIMFKRAHHPADGMKKILSRPQHQPSINVYGSDDWQYRPKQLKSSGIEGRKPRGWNFKRSDYQVHLTMTFDVWKSNVFVESRTFKSKYMINDVAFGGRNYKTKDTIEGRLIETLPDAQNKLTKRAHRELESDYPPPENNIRYNKDASVVVIARMGEGGKS